MAASQSMAQALFEGLARARAQQLRVFSQWPEDKLLGTQEHHLEPPIWEMGHVAWFQELHLLRGGNLNAGASRFPGGDSMYDSFNVDYRQRWSHDFPSRDETLEIAEAILGAVRDELAKLEGPVDQEGETRFRLAADHERMHTENLIALAQAMDVSLEIGDEAEPHVDTEFAIRDQHCGGGTFLMGADPAHGYCLDNERWQHPVEVPCFSIRNVPVTCGEYLEFVESGAYADRSVWDRDGWDWRRREEVDGPLYWKKVDGEWKERRFGAWREIRAYHPMCFVNQNEARAFCRFAGRRLPTEAEWEWAALFDEAKGEKRFFPWGAMPPDRARANLLGDFLSTVDVRAHAEGDSASGCRQMMGNVWEWTDTKLGTYPGFELLPYAEYSEPYLNKKPVLRGGAFATSAELLRGTWRNFFLKKRRNIFAGFRTCAL